MKPRVSIVTPSYNQAQFLEATMLSVIRQDYQDLEYLVVDGGSSDGSQDIILRYADRLKWWVSEPDKGQAEAINKGLQRATGEFVAWLNSDDLYLPGAVSQAVEIFAAHPEADVVYGNAVSADGRGNLLNELRFESWGLKDFLEFKIICQPAVFMRRTVVEKIGYLDDSYHFFLDHNLWIRLAKEYRFRHHPAFWAVSRYHADAKNLTLADQMGGEVYRILAWAEAQPDLSVLLKEDHNQIWAGAYAIIARYLLDAGKPRKAFSHYTKAARCWLPSLSSFWHRYLFAGLSILGLGFLGKWYYSLKQKRMPGIAGDPSLIGWPGIRMS